MTISHRITHRHSGMLTKYPFLCCCSTNSDSYAVPLVAFSFLGVEIVAVTAFEARKFRDLKWPSQWIAYVVFVFYILCGLGNALCVWWKDPNLPYAYGGLGNSSAIAEPKFVNPPSHSMPIIAAWQAGKESIPGFLNGCLIFSCLSAANTSLYAASRTLYGLARKVDDSTWIGGKFSGLATVESRNGVPIKALIISALAFFWLPFLQLKRAYGIELVGQRPLSFTLANTDAVDLNHGCYVQRELSNSVGSLKLIIHQLRTMVCSTSASFGLQPLTMYLGSGNVRTRSNIITLNTSGIARLIAMGPFSAAFSLGLRMLVFLDALSSSPSPALLGGILQLILKR